MGTHLLGVVVLLLSHPLALLQAELGAANVTWSITDYVHIMQLFIASFKSIETTRPSARHAVALLLP